MTYQKSKMLQQTYGRQALQQWWVGILLGSAPNKWNSPLGWAEDNFAFWFVYTDLEMDNFDI